MDEWYRAWRHRARDGSGARSPVATANATILALAFPIYIAVFSLV